MTFHLVRQFFVPFEVFYSDGLLLFVVFVCCCWSLGEVVIEHFWRLHLLPMLVRLWYQILWLLFQKVWKSFIVKSWWSLKYIPSGFATICSSLASLLEQIYFHFNKYNINSCYLLNCLINLKWRLKKKLLN